MCLYLIKLIYLYKEDIQLNCKTLLRIILIQLYNKGRMDYKCFLGENELNIEYDKLPIIHIILLVIILFLCEEYKVYKLKITGIIAL